MFTQRSRRPQKEKLGSFTSWLSKACSRFRDSENAQGLEIEKVQPPFPDHARPIFPSPCFPNLPVQKKRDARFNLLCC